MLSLRRCRLLVPLILLAWVRWTKVFSFFFYTHGKIYICTIIRIIFVFFSHSLPLRAPRLERGAFEFAFHLQLIFCPFYLLWIFLFFFLIFTCKWNFLCEKIRTWKNSSLGGPRKLKQTLTDERWKLTEKFCENRNENRRKLGGKAAHGRLKFGQFLAVWVRRDDDDEREDLLGEENVVFISQQKKSNRWKSEL